MFDKHLGRKWDVIPSSFKTHYSHWQIERIFDHQWKTTLGYIRKDLCSQLWKLKPLTFWDTPLFRPTLWFEGSIDRPLSSSYSIQYLLSKLIRQSKLALKKLYIYLRIISIFCDLWILCNLLRNSELSWNALSHHLRIVELKNRLGGIRMQTQSKAFKRSSHPACLPGKIVCVYINTNQGGSRLWG